MNTINKLKNLIAPAAPNTVICISSGTDRFSGNNQTITPTESAHLLTVLTSAPYYYVNGVPQPMTPGVLPAPVPAITVPASQTTAQVINATLVAANSQVDPAARFIEYFPPPVPPPQELQPGFVRYNINYGPTYVVPPCVGPRQYRA